ncbi:MAG: diaminopimelate dehydrogenase [Oscillospiraceae bacterium]|nr:diaminopimelate dehydrogenase [Oscillospiraceae bacterium]
MKIRVGAVGYGNLGRGMEYAIAQTPDMELRCIVTRREPSGVKPATDGVEVLHIGDIRRLAGEVDVMVLCGGSATDLPAQTPEFAKLFNVVDSFDTHAKIPEHFKNVDGAAKSGGHTAIISAGWDPGLFSVNRMVSEAVLPAGGSYTFWGKGVSQGHSDAIRRIEGVADARQYTVPVQSALEAVRGGQNPEIDTRQKHTRECFVVAKEGADLSRIEREIITMPDYFADYHTSVRFISAEELAKDHSGMPHGGFVIRGGKTGRGNENSQIIEYGLKLDSNPEFTAGVLTVCARAACRLNAEGVTGCKTMFDIPPAYFSAESGDELRKRYL